MTRTKHFDISEWADFVRGAADAAAREEQERHLASGCMRCNQLAGLLQRFAAAAPGADVEPAAQTVVRAEAIFPRRQPRSLLPRLVFDSFREPLPAGIRAADRPARHVLYEAGNFLLDMQLEREPGSNIVTLVGQLSDRQTPTAAIDAVPVLLMGREGPVASAMCNRVGEFQLSYKPARRLRLHVLVQKTGGRLDVGLDRLTPVRPRSPRTPEVAGIRRRAARRLR